MYIPSDTHASYEAVKRALLAVMPGAEKDWGGMPIVTLYLLDNFKFKSMA